MENVTFWSRISLFWRFQLVGWAAYEFLTFRLKVLILGSVRKAIIVSLLRGGLAFLLTLGMRSVYRRMYGKQMRLGGIGILVIGVSAIGGLLLVLFSFGARQFVDLEELHLPFMVQEYEVFYICAGLFLCWSLLYFGIKLMRDAWEKDLRLARAESKQHEAELQMLRAQMNPHFLFNALNTVRAGLETHQQSLKDLVEALASYLRYSLAHRSETFVPIEEEFNALKDYLTVQKARFQEQLEVECQIEDAARSFPVPGIILQPLVENAIKYGRQTSPRLLRVRIHIRCPTTETIQMEVANSGRWIEPENPPRLGGVGLANLRRRLELLYPGGHKMEITTDSGMVRVTVQISDNGKIAASRPDR